MFHFSLTRQRCDSFKIKMKILLPTIIFYLVTASDGGVSMNNPFYCYSTDLIRPQTGMHSTRTSYEAVRRTSVNPTVSCKFWKFCKDRYAFANFKITNAEWLLQRNLFWRDFQTKFIKMFSLYSGSLYTVKVLVPE